MSITIDVRVRISSDILNSDGTYTDLTLQQARDTLDRVERAWPAEAARGAGGLGTLASCDARAVRVVHSREQASIEQHPATAEQE